jgi:hypothetical protein
MDMRNAEEEQEGYVRLEIRNQNSEGRDPKSEGNPKSEGRNPKAFGHRLRAEYWRFGFRTAGLLRAFGFRISDFGSSSLPRFCLAVLLFALPRGPRPALAEDIPPVPRYAEVYGRATNSFAEAVFFKPVEGRSSELSFELAPLIIQEVKETPRAVILGRDRFGSLSLTNGLLALAGARPAVYASLDAAQLNGKPHLRLTYLWCYRLEPGRPGAGLPVQGIRITLDAAGNPAVWEVLAEDSGAELIFVSQNLEAAAVAQFGKPLPGRRYALERSVTQAPRVIVARVLEDAPVAMGPIVYLRAGTRSVSTVICRCMAAQVKGLAATSAYELRFCQGASADPLLAPLKTRAGNHTAFWPGDEPAGNRLERCLRLPAGF